jgi:hypothetical protein
MQLDSYITPTHYNLASKNYQGLQRALQADSSGSTDRPTVAPWQPSPAQSPNLNPWPCFTTAIPHFRPFKSQLLAKSIMIQLF